MKKLKTIPILLAALAATGQVASALNYNANDLLLVFRQDGGRDVEFDLGSVSSYLGQPLGTRIPVSYNLATVLSNFSGSLSGVKFGLAAAVAIDNPNQKVWVSDGNLSKTPANMTGSGLSVVRDKIESVGVYASYATSSNAFPYAVSTAASASYDYLVTSGTGSAVSTMGGSSPSPVGSVTSLPVDARYPTTLAFYEVNSANQSAATMIGAFTLDGQGNLFFTAGQLPPLIQPQITGIVADPNVSGTSSVSFTSTNGINYQLLSSPSLDSPSWAPVLGVSAVPGDGTVLSVTNNASLDDMLFYRIKGTY